MASKNMTWNFGRDYIIYLVSVGILKLSLPINAHCASWYLFVFYKILFHSFRCKVTISLVNC